MPKPTIYVLAGVNGSGKSSILGAAIEANKVPYFNPDEAARKLRSINPGISQHMANAHAWSLGKEMLENAIAFRKTFAFETTLGGSTITSLLREASQKGIDVVVSYAGLDSVEQNIERVRARVERGGHDIPESAIRKRWDSSRRNLIKLIPHLRSLKLYDNSRQAAPELGKKPEPLLLLHIDNKSIIGPADLSKAPGWAKPIIVAALNAFA